MGESRKPWTNRQITNATRPLARPSIKIVNPDTRVSSVGQSQVLSHAARRPIIHCESAHQTKSQINSARVLSRVLYKTGRQRWVKS